MENKIDIKENYIYQLDTKLLAILLLDKSSGKNIIWATDNYAERGFGYQSNDKSEWTALRTAMVVSSDRGQQNPKKNKQFAFVTKRRFLPPPGCATIKIIS